MIPDKHRVKAEQVGTLWAIDLFCMFTEDNTRGPKFTWQDIEDTIIKMVEASCWISFSDNVWHKYKKEITDISIYQAKETYKSLKKILYFNPATNEQIKEDL